MSAIADLVGPQLNGKYGKQVATKDLSNNNEIGLYFSAHWCPPCRHFTPKLAEYYNALKSAKPNDLEIVFVSSDRSEPESTEYFETMPWLMIPYASDETRRKLLKKYAVSGIPMLVIVDGSTGELVTKDGRGRVTAS